MIKCKNKCPLDKFDGCCYSCMEFATCSERCDEHYSSCADATFDEDDALMAFNENQSMVLQQIAALVTQKKAIEAEEKRLKDALKDAMEKYGVTKFESELLNITYVAATTSSSVDTAKLKKLHPEIAAQCTKISPKSAYIKVTVKGGEK